MENGIRYLKKKITHTLMIRLFGKKIKKLGHRIIFYDQSHQNYQIFSRFSQPSDFEPTRCRPKKSKSKPKGVEALNSVKEARMLEKEMLKKEKET